MAKESYHGPLEKVDSCCYRIPKSYKAGMLVDGLIFANEKLLGAIQKDQAVEQVANVAFLPGIQKASLAMPDIHWGYGFCIGGVAATDPAEGGVISPGGVGYDINCLTGDAKVLHQHGFTRPIDQLANEWKDASLACFSLNEALPAKTRVVRWFSEKPSRPVLEVVTHGGDVIRATADHPFWTPQGMLKLGELRPEDLVAVAPFEGVPYEQPTDEVIVSEEAVIEKLSALGIGANGAGCSQVLTYLRDRNLLPLRYSSPATPNLCKILGFVFGDGNLHFPKAGKGVTAFYGKAADLELIRADIEAIGVTPSRVYSRDRQHAIRTTYREYSFEHREEWFKVVGRSFAVLLACLEAPVGKKSHQTYGPPQWLNSAPLWQRRLFLAAFFGAELSSPVTVPNHPTVMAAPTISMNKRISCEESGRQFLQEIAGWLDQFGVVTQTSTRRAEQTNADGERSIRFRLTVSNDSDNLIRLWSRVGFEYNRTRSGRACEAVQYLKHKRKFIACREEVAERAVAMKNAGARSGVIVSQLASAKTNARFIERSLYEGRKTACRAGDSFVTFAEFRDEISIGENANGMVWDTVESIQPIKYDGLVYDFTVDHPDHNFVANGFVVSNCGVRLIRSNLYVRDVKPYLRSLIKCLFETVPAGVGRSGKYKFNEKEMAALLGQGTSYVVGRGLGVPRDLGHIEATGRIDGADPDDVSPHAISRGLGQCGTLGSGNHFMEVQVVDHIFDEEVATAFGLEKDMICVMIHSGSRGLGYQVCDDALAVFRNAPEKYGITLPDRQLACAPADSPEGRKYIAAMRAAANFGFCNRQLLMQQAREVFAEVFGRSWEDLGMELLYDVAHNIAKLEEHAVDGVIKKLWVHRKGATRAFPAGHPELPDVYRKVGQPVIIPGDMGRASWVLVGMPGSMERTFGTTCHGAGRAMSRTAAVKDAASRRIDKELEAKGIIAMASSRKGLMEEQPRAYKNVDDVVDVVHDAGLSKKVARMRPIGVIKG